MIHQNFAAIGRSPNHCLFVHKDNVSLLPKYGYGAKVQCIGIRFTTGEISDPVIVDRFLKFWPHVDICSEGERQVIGDLVRESLSEEKIEMLNQKFEEVRYYE